LNVKGEMLRIDSSTLSGCNASGTAQAFSRNFVPWEIVAFPRVSDEFIKLSNT